jgi:hypothetical protein
MDDERQFAAHRASLRAGVAGTVMIVLLCFSAALAFSDVLVAH